VTGDVLAVPHPPYLDTTGVIGEERFYAVTTLSDIAVQGDPSERVSATPTGQASPVDVIVDSSAGLGELAGPWRRRAGERHVRVADAGDEVPQPAPDAIRTVVGGGR